MRVGPAVLREATIGAQAVRLRRSATFAGRGVPHGEGEPVVLVPGFLCDDGVLALMHGWLRRLGYRTYGGGLGRNTACGEVSVARLEAHVEGIAARHGRRVAVLGYSRGGQFARVVAVRRPDLVSGVATLGAPSLDPRGVHVAAGLPAVAVTALGSLGVPGLMGFSCFLGRCCDGYRADLATALPDGVGSVAVRSARDQIVDHRYTPDVGARRVQIDCTHTGYLANHEAYGAVADALHTFRQITTTTPGART